MPCEPSSESLLTSNSPALDQPLSQSRPAESRCATCIETNVPKHPYRIFISYSHQDQGLAVKLRDYLRAQGLFPITDHEIRVGEAFSEEIRDMIECAHVFMPLVTASANERLWVQQEIGYASALHVPVCPVAIGKLPSGMAEHIQGVHIVLADNEQRTDDELMEIIRGRLNYEMIDDLVRRARRRPRQGRYDCALDWTDRQTLLVALTEAAYRGGCKMVRKLGQPEDLDRGVWRLRQYAAFGSFSIPDAGVNSPLWGTRDPDCYRSHHERRLLRRERQAMDAYTRCFGCDMILDPRINTAKRDDAAKPPAPDRPGTSSPISKDNLRFKHPAEQTSIRIQLILDFLHDHIADDRVRVIVPKHQGEISTNLIIVGDWFAAEAVVPLYPGGGYERTSFTRHAPTVLNMIARFSQDFEDYFKAAGLDPDDPGAIRKAKAAAVEVLKNWLVELAKTGG